MIQLIKSNNLKKKLIKMASTLNEQNQQQLQSRSMFQTIFYSMSKKFFDEINIEINGKRKGIL